MDKVRCEEVCRREEIAIEFVSSADKRIFQWCGHI